MGRPIKTKNNDLFMDQVISALQKDIRRGQERRAMAWALELVPYFEQYLWRRLVTISQEDIGIANPQLLVLVASQRELYFEFRAEGRDGPARLILANTVLAMCRSPKSRIADHFQCAVHQALLHGEVPEIPDYALDKHTNKGKSLGRGVEHWRDEGCQLHPESDVDDPYADEAYEWWGGDFIKVKWPPRKRSGRKGNGDSPTQARLF